MSTTRTRQHALLAAAVAMLLITSACGAVAGLRPDAPGGDVAGPIVGNQIVGDPAVAGRPAEAVATVATTDVVPVELPGAVAAEQRSSVTRPTPTPSPTFARHTPTGTEPAASPAVPTWPTPDATSSTIVLVGDSLAEETSGVIAMLTAPKSFVPRYWGGTAPCDWLDDDLIADRASVVVITFTGNSLTPCMSDGAGGHLEHRAFAARYRADLTELVDHARRTGARVVLVGQPYRAASFDHTDRVDAINQVIQELAQASPFVSYVDAGAAVETTDGGFSDRLPCAFFDLDCDADGTTVVRGDGVHFCPVVNVHPCPVYSSGAFRFGAAIATAANNPTDFE